MSNGFYIVTFILSVTFGILALEKLYAIITRKNIFEKYNFGFDVIFILAILDLFGATTIWMKYSFIGSLGALTLGCLSLGSIFFNIKFKSFKESMPAWISLFFSITVFLEYLIIG